MNQRSEVDNHSASKSVFLHLLPGLLIAVAYFLMYSVFTAWKYPSVMALMGAIFFALMPIELGILYYEGKKKNGRLSLEGVVLYRNRIPFWQYLVGVPVLFIILGLIFTFMKPVDEFIRLSIFAWIPTLDGGLKSGLLQSTLIWTYLFVAIFGVILGPIVEEFYFRGYLLPRMSFAGKWAPFLNSFLFALYHFWTPWMLITRTLGALVLAYAARRRSLYLSIAVHILVNSVDLVTGVIFILAMKSVV